MEGRDRQWLCGMVMAQKREVLLPQGSVRGGREGRSVHEEIIERSPPYQAMLR